MEFSDDAKLEIEKSIRDTLKKINLDRTQRKEIEKELRSTYYEAAEAAARSRGADTVMAEDVRGSASRIGSPAENANCIMRAHAGTMRKAGFPPRAIAFVIDFFVIGLATGICMLPILLIGLPFLLAGKVIVDGSNIDINMAGTTDLLLAMAAIIVVAFIVLVDVIVFFGYYFLLEGHFGYTVGKYILGMRVLKTDYTRIGYTQAILRNISKYFYLILAIDTLILFSNGYQRGSDMIANTIVVHTRDG